MMDKYRVIFLFFLIVNTFQIFGQDTITRPLQKLKGHTEDVEVITYSPDGKFIASAGWDNTIRIWNTQTGTEIKNFKAHDASIRCLEYSRDGKYLISGARDNSVKIWDSTWNIKYSLFGHQNIVNAVLLDPKMRYAYSAASDGAVKIWDLKKKGESRNLKKFDQPVNALALSLTGADVYVATKGPEIYKLDVKGAVKATFTNHTDEINSLAYALNNKYLLSGSSDKTAVIWDVLKGEPRHILKGHNWKVTSVAFSYDSKYAVTGSTDGTVKLWEVETGNLISTFIGGVTSVSAVAMSPDITKIATAGMVNSIEPDANKFLIYIWATNQELESVKIARMKKFKQDSIQFLKDSVKRLRDSVKLVQDSLKKLPKPPKTGGKEKEKGGQNPPPVKNDSGRKGAAPLPKNIFGVYSETLV